VFGLVILLLAFFFLSQNYYCLQYNPAESRFLRGKSIHVIVDDPSAGSVMQLYTYFLSTLVNVVSLPFILGIIKVFAHLYQRPCVQSAVMPDVRKRLAEGFVLTKRPDYGQGIIMVVED
jgi:hypothetical protein